VQESVTQVTAALVARPIGRPSAWLGPETTAALLVGLLVTLVVGGPHMYSTYLRTTLDPRFRRRWGALAYSDLGPRL